MKTEELFKVGDVIRLKDGDGRHHIIKELIWEYDLRGEATAIVIFEDNTAKGFICSTYTDMIKIL